MTARCAATIEGRTVLITGASDGIGKQVALDAAAAGAHVLLVSRTREKLEAVQAEIEEAGGTAFVHPCDLSDMDDIVRMAEEVLEEHDGVDVLDQQRRPVDPALGEAVLRPLPRLRAHDAAQLLRGGPADPRRCCRR